MSTFTNAAEGTKLVSANNKFALGIYKHHAAASTGNLFMSPVSISVAMAMTYLGARGETMTQMRDALFFGDVSDLALHGTFSELRGVLSGVSDKYVLQMANRLFGEKTFNFLSEFLNEGRKYYGAELAVVDFLNNASGATELINNWVAENTNQKIKGIIPPGTLDSSSRLVLVNAAYFKSDWRDKFEAAYTSEQDFHVTPTETVRVQMMYQSLIKKFRHGVDPDLACQILELPYVDSALSMFVLLPDETTNVNVVETKLTPEHFSDPESKFHMRVPDRVKVWLPRFNLEEHFDLVGTLKQLGCPDLFVACRADLSGMDGSRGLSVSSILHQAFIKVNEEGTEAAAATVCKIGVGCALIQDNVDFRADHPFIFFIRHNITKSILFVGRCAKP